MKGLTHPAAIVRLNAQRFRLEGSNCPACGIRHFPPRPVCPDCGEGGVFPKKDIEKIPQVLCGKERSG